MKKIACDRCHKEISGLYYEQEIVAATTDPEVAVDDGVERKDICCECLEVMFVINYAF